MPLTEALVASVAPVTGIDQLYTFTYYYGSGDYYSGFGYASAGTYYAGNSWSYGSLNDTQQQGYYVIDAAYNLGSETYQNSVVNVFLYYDASTDADAIGTGGYGNAGYIIEGFGYSGLGSETGSAYDVSGLATGDNFFNWQSSADIDGGGYFGDVMVISSSSSPTIISTAIPTAVTALLRLALIFKARS